jgi:hypothetical protein
VDLETKGKPELSKFRFNTLLGFDTLLSRGRAIPNFREPFHFVVRKGAIEDGNATDPRGKRRVSIAVDDATYGKRSALLNRLGSIDIKTEIVGVGFHCNQLTLQWFP